LDLPLAKPCIQEERRNHLRAAVQLNDEDAPRAAPESRAFQRVLHAADQRHLARANIGASLF
jgi:hypothetical protein